MLCLWYVCGLSGQCGPCVFGVRCLAGVLHGCSLSVGCCGVVCVLVVHACIDCYVCVRVISACALGVCLCVLSFINVRVRLGVCVCVWCCVCVHLTLAYVSVLSL